jgi:hypothetical protein
MKSKKDVEKLNLKKFFSLMILETKNILIFAFEFLELIKKISIIELLLIKLFLFNQLKKGGTHG